MIPTILISKKHKSRLTIALVVSFCLIIIGQVAASRTFCRSDPIVYLSDGTRLQFNIEIETSLDDIISIRYEVHVPLGVQIDRIIYTPSWARSKEVVELINDQPAGSYQITTVAQTGRINVPTTVKAMMVTRRNGGEGSTHKSVTGVSGQAISITF